MPENNQKSAYKQRIRIRLKSYDHRIIDAAAKQIIETVERTGARTIGPIPLPTDRTVETVLRSPHVHKDSREQFELLVHKRVIDVYDPATNTLDNLMHLDIPAGVDVEMKT